MLHLKTEKMKRSKKQQQSKVKSLISFYDVAERDSADLLLTLKKSKTWQEEEEAEAAEETEVKEE